MNYILNFSSNEFPFISGLLSEEVARLVRILTGEKFTSATIRNSALSEDWILTYPHGRIVIRQSSQPRNSSRYLWDIGLIPNTIQGNEC